MLKGRRFLMTEILSMLAGMILALTVEFVLIVMVAEYLL